MGDRYLKKEDKTLQTMYATATKAEILAAIPNREWVPLTTHARRMGLRRSQTARGKQIWIGRCKSKEKEREDD